MRLLIVATLPPGVVYFRCVRGVCECFGIELERGMLAIVIFVKKCHIVAVVVGECKHSIRVNGAHDCQIIRFASQKRQG
eukprot:8682042-Karenia_brevis.AAC.1